MILDGLGLTLDAPGAEITDTNTTKIVGLLVEASKLDRYIAMSICAAGASTARRLAIKVTSPRLFLGSVPKDQIFLLIFLK